MKKSLKKFDIETVLNNLSGKRPVFHNERDFQFELGICIKEEYECEIRLEYFFGLQGNEQKRCYLDIVAFSEKEKYCIAFELKYKTQKVNNEFLKHKKEKFYLKDQGAQDYGCCDVYSDIRRLELLLNNDTNNGYKIKNNPFINYSNGKGYVIFITNDDKYYDKGFKEGSLFSDFSFNNKELKSKPKFKTKNKRIEDTCAAKYKDLEEYELKNNYKIDWKDWNENNIDIELRKFKRVYFEIK